MKIAQASLINTMMKSLTSTNAQERKLAVNAVLIALPDQGPMLVRTIAQSDEDKSVQAAARQSLETRVTVLIRQLFASEARERISAAQDLVQGWRNDSSVVLELVTFAMQNSKNVNGVYNTVGVLNEFSLGALQAHKAEILKFVEVAKPTGSKTAAGATVLAKRVGA